MIDGHHTEGEREREREVVSLVQCFLTSKQVTGIQVRDDLVCVDDLVT